MGPGPDISVESLESPSDFINGQRGNDKVWARPRDDGLVGGKGDDLLDGQQGKDHIEGGPGDDRCRGPIKGRSCEDAAPRSTSG